MKSKRGFQVARKRMIDPEFWTDDKTMKLSPRARLLFIGIWNFNDDKGIHKNSDYMLKAEIFPCDEITVKQVGELKDDLIKEGLIVPFQDNGIELFYTKNWKIYQYIQKPVPSKYSLPEDYHTPTIGVQPNRIEKNRIEKNKIEKKVVEVPTTTSLQNVKDKDKDTGFEKFWESYPRKVAKSYCKKIWISKKCGDLADVILKDVKGKIESIWKNSIETKDIQFIPHPRTYLNQKRWESEDHISEKDPEKDWDKVNRKGLGYATT